MEGSKGKMVRKKEVGNEDLSLKVMQMFLYANV